MLRGAILRGLAGASRARAPAMTPSLVLPRALATTAAPKSATWLEPKDTFPRRHLGVNDEDVTKMLGVIGEKTLDEFISKTVPKGIRLDKLPHIPALSESEALKALTALGEENKVLRSYIGQGYYGTLTPTVIKRNILENPGWYTQYTPYQAEVAQGRLESLLNYQTMVQNLTGMDVSNASLLDEATAGAEAMAICFSTKGSAKRNKYLVDEKCHPQTIALIKTRAEPFGVEVVVGSHKSFDFSKNDVFGVAFQYPNTEGTLEDFAAVTAKAHDNGALVTCASDMLALTVITPPGEFGVDVCFGSSQRFGVPMGFGGPHAAFIAVKDPLKRRLPGRLIGATIDANGRLAYRLALQTRETHIRRERATSNICTAQALLANMNAMYAIYHGPKGLKDIANRVHKMTVVLADALKAQGHKVQDGAFFDTLTIAPTDGADAVIKRGLAHGINFRKLDSGRVGVSLDETVTAGDLKDIISAFSTKGPISDADFAKLTSSEPASRFGSFARKSEILTHPIFNSHHSETKLMRYAKKLENKDVSLVHSMIPLGSCTMKLNSATEMQAVTWPKFANLHPFAPQDQAKGYIKMFEEISEHLCHVTGYDAISLQPNSGAQGEYAGLLTIRAYQKAIGQGHRNVCLIPESAHGTNPASAAMCALKIVVVKVTKNGDIDLDDMRAKCEEHSKNLSCVMITYPSTYGVFDEQVRDICDLIHKHGGQVYLDGANMNAQTMLCRPGDYGADVSHLNLHKTFCIPHGGGGPGMGPIGVKKHLAPFLPEHAVIKGIGQGTDAHPAGQVSAGPYGSSLITTIPWLYIKMMGSEGLKQATSIAILNANYMAARLSPYYQIAFRGSNGYCAHEFIIDMKNLKHTGIECTQVAKRLQDFGFHAPTMAWPVPNSLMIEPTESESLDELERYIEALITIRKEIDEVANGVYPKDNNVLVNAPHDKHTIASEWNRPYSIQKAAFPLPWVLEAKMWPGSARVDDVHGDKNLICSCPALDEYK